MKPTNKGRTKHPASRSGGSRLTSKPRSSVASVTERTVDVERTGDASVPDDLETATSVASVPSDAFFSRERKEKDEENSTRRRRAERREALPRANDATDETDVHRPVDPQAEPNNGAASSAIAPPPSVDPDPDAAAKAAPQATESGTGAKRESQRRALMVLAEDFELFHDANGTAYATIPTGLHRETWPLKAGGVRDVLMGRYYRDRGQPPDERALTDVLRNLEARARLDGSERKVFRRVGEHEGVIWLDLCDDKWRSVRILGGHLKTGQWLTAEKRPMASGPDGLSLSTLLIPLPASRSRFWCASFAVRI